MCEWSLESYDVTDAQKGVSYEIERFPTGTKGLKARLGEITRKGATVCGTDLCAACLPVGSVCHLERPDGSTEVAVFAKLDIQPAPAPGAPTYWNNQHKDGFIFKGGRNVSMQSDADIPKGTKLTVLVLGYADAKEDTALASPAPAISDGLAMAMISELVRE